MNKYQKIFLVITIFVLCSIIFFFAFPAGRAI